MMNNPKWICHRLDGDDNRLVPVFRKCFLVNNTVSRAVLEISAHGIYHACMNGIPVSESKFTPGLTSYYYRIQVQSYEVSRLLHRGENEWLTTVGDGWWRWRNNFGYRLALWGRLTIEYADGSSQVIATDESFQAGTGPVVRSDLQKGEVYDARLVPGNWTNAAEEKEHTGAVMIADESVPVREKERFRGKLFRDSQGNLVADFGQNIAGYVHMVLHHTKPGQVVHLKHGEALDPDGCFSTSNCDGGMKEFQEITYICKGAQSEEYTPRFAYFGFRYAKIEGIDDGEFTAVAVYSDLPQTGDFHCSNPLINRLVENARWSQKGNFLDVPVDCPTRERNAWTGDAQVYVTTASYFMDVSAFFRKWLVDQSIEQYASGKVGITFPSTSSVHNPAELKRVQQKNPDMALAGPKGNGNIGEDSVGWGDSAVWLPYQLYLMYGDIRFVQEHYQTAKRWLEYSLACMKEKNPRYADRDWYRNGDGDDIYDTRFHYGEWNEPLPPAKEVIALFQHGGKPADYVRYMAQFGQPEVATAYTARSCDVVAIMADLLGKPDDAARYRLKAEKIRAAYNKYMISEDGVIQKGHQAPYVRALAMNLADAHKKPLVIAQLKKEIIAANYHLNTGFLSTGYLLPVLCDNGMTDEAFRILEQTTAPGWLHPVTLGATTIPENWDGFDVFRDSLNHYSFGSVCQFLFAYVAGIRPMLSAPGFREFELKPVAGGSLDWAKASYMTKYGRISSGWKRVNDEIVYECTVPNHTKAHLTLMDGSRHTLSNGSYQFRVKKEKADGRVRD